MKKYPIVTPVKLHKIGGSYGILLPKEWFENQNINPENVAKLLLKADRDVIIVNPKDTKKEYREIFREDEKK